MTTNGVFVSGESRRGGGDVMELIDPSTDGVIDAIGTASLDDVDDAVASAAAAQLEWARRTPGERAAVLLALADAVMADS